MKTYYEIIKQVLVVGVVLALATNCGTDDAGPIPNPNPNTGEAKIRILQVNATTDEIILKNFGDAAADISSYWICNLKSYVQISTLSSGNLDLNPDQTIILNRVMVDAASDVGLYSTDDFDNAMAMEDFMQYGQAVGAAGSADVAVTKGIWTDGEFVDGVSPYDYTGNGDQNGLSFWTGVPVSSPANVRIVIVDAANDKITLKNFGGTAQDVNSYWICNLKTYAQLNGLASGDMILDPDETIELSREIDDTASDVGLYSTNAFSDDAAMIDFMQYGIDVSTDGRAEVAATKGIWNLGDFVSGASPYDYNGNGNENGASFWSGS